MVQPGDYIKMNLRDFNGAAPYRVITSQRLTCPANASTPSAAFNSSTVAVMVGTIMQNPSADLGICFKFGSDPTASLSDPILPHMVINSHISAGGSGYLTFKVTPGDKVAFIPSGNYPGDSSAPAQQKVVIIELGY